MNKKTIYLFLGILFGILLTLIIATEGDYTGNHWDTLTSGLGSPRGMTNNNTFIWIIDDNGNSPAIAKYHLNGTFISYFGDALTNGSGSTFLGITQNGTYMWVTDYTTDEVWQYNMTGNSTKKHWDTAGSGNAAPRGLTQNNTYFWIVDSEDSEIYRYNMSGTYLSKWSVGDCTEPYDITTNNTNFWILNSSGSVCKYNMSGEYLSEFDTDAETLGKQPNGLTSNNSYFWISIRSGDEVYIYRTALDIFAPNISIAFPTNFTNSSNNELDINFTVEDELLNSCWYSNDSYDANTTLANCINITDVTWIDGKHNVTVWVNDSINNINSSFVTFTIDTTPPNLSIISPNGSLSSKTIIVNISSNESRTELNYCYFNITTSVGATEVPNTAINISQLNATTLVTSETDYIFNVACNDSLDNVNSSSTNFSVSLSSPASPGGSTGGGGGFIEKLTKTVISSYCEPKHPIFENAWDNFFKDKTWENFKILWFAFWDVGICDASASIIPLQIETNVTEKK
jgi:hypothetical protein